MPKPVSSVPFLVLTCGVAVCAFAEIRPLSVSAPSDEKIGGYLGQRIPLSVINAPCVPYNPPAE